MHKLWTSIFSNAEGSFDLRNIRLLGSSLSAGLLLSGCLILPPDDLLPPEPEIIDAQSADGSVVPDTNPPQAGRDSGLDGQPDAGRADAGRADAGQAEAGQAEAGQAEAGQPEAGQPDAGQPDAGQPDAGPDANPPILPELGPAVLPRVHNVNRDGFEDLTVVVPDQNKILIYLGGRERLGARALEIPTVHPVSAFAFHGPFPGGDFSWGVLVTLVQKPDESWHLQRYLYDEMAGNYAREETVQVMNMEHTPGELPTLMESAIVFNANLEPAEGIVFGGSNQLFTAAVSAYDPPVSNIREIPLNNIGLNARALFSVPGPDGIDILWVAEENGWRRFKYDDQILGYRGVASHASGNWEMFAWTQLNLDDNATPEFLGATRGLRKLFLGFDNPTEPMAPQEMPIPDGVPPGILFDHFVNGQFNVDGIDLVLFGSNTLVTVEHLGTNANGYTTQEAYSERLSVHWIAAGQFSLPPLDLGGIDQLLILDNDGLHCRVLHPDTNWQDCGWWP